jgi:hypothetical protein
MHRHGVKRSHDQPDSAPGDGGPGEAAAFISGAVAELAVLARRHGHDALGFLLDMAQMEAGDIARRHYKPGER